MTLLSFALGTMTIGLRSLVYTFLSHDGDDVRLARYSIEGVDFFTLPILCSVQFKYILDS